MFRVIYYDFQIRTISLYKVCQCLIFRDLCTTLKLRAKTNMDGRDIYREGATQGHQNQSTLIAYFSKVLEKRV